jgi:hypothetical protein
LKWFATFPPQDSPCPPLFLSPLNWTPIHVDLDIQFQPHYDESSLVRDILERAEDRLLQQRPPQSLSPPLAEKSKKSEAQGIFAKKPEISGNFAARCIQRTFRRWRVAREVRSVLAVRRIFRKTWKCCADRKMSFEKALHALSEGDAAETEKQLRRLIASDENAAVFSLGLLMERQGRLEEAAEFLARAVQLSTEANEESMKTALKRQIYASVLCKIPGKEEEATKLSIEVQEERQRLLRI